MDDNTKLKDKKIDELTVGDAIKVNVGIAALSVAAPLVTLAAIGAVSNGIKKVRDARHRRRVEKTNKEE